MFIKRIYLENYRAHSKCEIELDRGLNLFLGQNGSGKSSILEAIGITLFGSNPRNSSSLKECIKKGEKRGIIKIDFIGNDDMEYRIEKELKSVGSGYNKLYMVNSQEECLTSKGEIEDRLQSLIGVHGDVKKIYDNVIVAKQNEFIGIYKETEVMRKATFDKIFDTEIYNNISKGFAKEVGDKYLSEKIKKEGEIKGISSNLEDNSEIEMELKEKKNVEDFLKKERDEIILKRDELGLKIKELENLIRENEALKKEMNSLLFNEKRVFEDIKMLNSQIENAKKAAIIVAENENEYKNYQKSSEEEKKQIIRLQMLQNDISKLHKIQTNIGEKSNFKEKIKGDIKENLIRCENYKKELQLLMEEINSLKEKIEKNRIRKDELFNETNRLKKIEDLIKKHEKEYLDAKSNYELHQLNINREKIAIEVLKDKIIDENSVKIKMNTLEELNKSFKKLKELEDKEKELNIIINQNNKAQMELKNSICPFLFEKCKNLNGKDIINYYNEKNNKLKEELEKLSEDMEKIKEKTQERESLMDELQEQKKLIKNYDNLNSNFEKLVLEGTINQSNVELCELKFETFEEKNGKKEDIIKNITLYQAELEVINNDKCCIELTNKNNEIQKKEIFIRKLELEKIKLQEEIILLDKEIENLNKSGMTLSKSNELFIKERESYNFLKKRMESEEKSALKYTSNLKVAESLQGLKEKLREGEEYLKDINEKKKKISEKIEENTYKIGFQEDLEKLNGLNQELNKNLAKIIENLGVTSVEIKNLEKRMELNRKNLEKIRTVTKEIAKIEKKIDLTGKFRENLKNMGSKVSQNFLKRISFDATENFRKITGRSERILWSSINESYEVILENGDSLISFEHLSGGEQVAVAIAIRGAMTKHLSNSKFLIFDEPTNNLDRDRKRSLAENIGEILEDLDQSIIVTHDNTFREMAQKVIEL